MGLKIEKKKTRIKAKEKEKKLKLISYFYLLFQTHFTYFNLII